MCHLSSLSLSHHSHSLRAPDLLSPPNSFLLPISNLRFCQKEGKSISDMPKKDNARLSVNRKAAKKVVSKKLKKNAMAANDPQYTQEAAQRLSPPMFVHVLRNHNKIASDHSLPQQREMTMANALRRLSSSRSSIARKLDEAVEYAAQECRSRGLQHHREREDQIMEGIVIIVVMLLVGECWWNICLDFGVSKTHKKNVLFREQVLELKFLQRTSLRFWSCKQLSPSWPTSTANYNPTDDRFFNVIHKFIIFPSLILHQWYH